MGIFDVFKNLTKPRERDRIAIDDRGVRRYRGDELLESVEWAKLVEVGIITTSEGPFVEDVFFMLVAEDGTGCAVPQGISDGLLEALQRLPGFDNMAVITAMGSCEDARFVCWRRGAGRASA